MFDSFNLEFALWYGLSKRHASGKNLPLKFLCAAAATYATLFKSRARKPLEGKFP
jgi:hypothetical protein